MAIIRLSTDEVFGVDSQEYDILADAAMDINGIDGAVVEIGSRRGGSAKIIIDGLTATNNTKRPMFCIDPYGNIDYLQTHKALSVHHPEMGITDKSTDKTEPTKLDYDNTMRNRIIPSLYYYAYQAGLNFTFFCLEDKEFFKRYADGVPVYDEYKTLVNKYALVFFDGPHNNDAVIEEVEFFLSRTPVGGIYVFDDIWMYDHEKIENEYLYKNGFKLVKKGSIKASYKKIK